MKAFIRKYEDRIHGVLSCFDRMLFRGYLPIMSGWAMAGFLDRLNVNFGNLKRFLLENSERVNHHAIAMAQKHGRPFRYLASNIDKDRTARQLAQRDGIEHGLVCIFSILEPCRSFSFLFKKPLPNQAPFCQTRTTEVSAPVLLLYGSKPRLDPCAYSNLVSDADPDLYEWARMARAQAGGQRHSLHQIRECISVDRGYGQSAEVRRSFRESELAQDSQQVCQAGHAANAGYSSGLPALLGDGSK